MKAPKYIEVEPDSFKSLFDCNHAELLGALSVEREPSRRRAIHKLMARYKSLNAPLELTVGEIDKAYRSVVDLFARQNI
jgi:hypothetical protein